MRMDLSKALTRRILHGDIAIERDKKDYVVAYDRVTASVIGRRMVIELWTGNVMLSSVDAEYQPGQEVHLTGIEGRLRIHIDETSPHAQNWTGHIQF